MADIREVAQLAGVSISTVSRVINGSKNVSAELTVKVEQAIAALNYSTNSIGRSLKSVVTKEIVVIVTSISRVFFLPVLEGITQEAIKDGYVVQIMETHDDIETEMQLVDFAVSKWVDGIILASSAFGRDSKTNKYVRKLSSLEKKGQRIPVVELEYISQNKKIDSVVVDHKKAAYEAVDYLINKVNKKKIVHISPPRSHYMGSLRLDGYRNALEDNGIPFSDDYVLEGDYSTYSGYKLILQFIEKGFPFDAIFCANDQMAVGAIKACEEKKLTIPEQVAIMGYDDIITASVVTPSLSSVMIPKFDMGAVAMKILKKKLEGKENKRVLTTLKTEIIERESTCRGAYQSLKNLKW